MSSNKKDEEISLYLSAITTRDPSKRQIKPVDKDAFQLFDDFESGSDEDFVLNSEEESDDNDDIREESDLEAEDEKDVDDDQKSDSCDFNTESVVNPGDKCSDSEICVAPIVTNCKLDNVMICMMCLLDVTYSDNEIVECDGCGVVVHEDCYKICDNVFMSCDNSDASTDPWFCDACLNNVQNPRCELCPVEGGVFKRTENNRWVHLQCALYTPGVAFNDVESLTEITLSELPLKEWSNRECCICTNPFLAKTGVCISCDAGLCKNFFHVLCAQKEGLLSEPNLEENPEDPYFAQCQQHTDKEVAKRRRKNWAAAVKRQQLRIESWKENSHFSDARLLRKLDYFSQLYRKAREGAPSPFVPSTKVPCFLETNPIAVFLFKKKAVNLRLPQEALNLHTGNTESKMSTGVPVFSPDFITYFVEREKKIDELSFEIVRLGSCHRDMQISEQNSSHQFNKIIAKKEATLEAYRKIRAQLCDLSWILEHMSVLPEIRELIDQTLIKFPTVCASSNVVHNSDNGSNDTTTNGVANSDNHGASNGNGALQNGVVINECCKCKSVSDQHLMIDCDDCLKFFHLNCLDPPLTRMPRKTKLYGWQCSSCGRSSSDDDHPKNIDVDRPRQLRKVSEISSRFKRFENITSSMSAKNRLVQNSKNIANKRTRRTILPPAVLMARLDDMDSEGTRGGKCDGTEDNATQRKSFRFRKRPLTLSREFETPPFPKRVKHSKFIRRKYSSLWT